MAQKNSMGMLSFFKAKNTHKIEFEHNKNRENLFRQNPEFLEFAKVYSHSNSIYRLDLTKKNGFLHKRKVCTKR